MQTIDIDDPSATEWVIGHDGKRVRVVRDKCVVRVPMRMRDAASVAGQIAERQRGIVDLAGNDGVALHRPGVRLMSDESTYDAAAAAYEQMIADTSDAWKRGPGGHAQDLGDGQQDAGSPAWRPGLSFSDAEAIKQKSYDEMVPAAETAWQNLRSL